VHNFQIKCDEYRNHVESHLNNLKIPASPESLYEPVKYVISGGGKRLRPLLTMLTVDTFKGNIDDALIAGVSIELLHNFTLVHDDIMDNADTRRGRLTVHKKWDRDIAILVGDRLIGLAYDTLMKISSSSIREITKAFTGAIIEVCEGQIYDKDFESKKNVSIDEYMMMISKKTGKLLEVCTVVGGMLAGASLSEIKSLCGYASNIGLAFQILDDLLDVIGDEKSFGKKPCGDIREGKKTYLLLKAIEKVDDESDKIILQKIIFKDSIIKDEDFAKKVTEIYTKYNILSQAREAIELYTSKANQNLNEISGYNTLQLKEFAEMLLNRKS